MHGGRPATVAPQLTSGVTHIVTGGRAFAAVKRDGNVVTWGGGFFRDPGLTVELTDGLRIRDAVGNDLQFAAILSDGSVLVWGNTVRRIRADFVDIFHTDTAFAAVQRDGSVMTGGHRDYGGNSSGVREQLDGRRGAHVTDIYSTNSAFAALRENGSVVTWGNDEDGGNSDRVQDQLANGVRYIVATGGAFAAVKIDGSVVTWGNAMCGGMVSEVTARVLREGLIQIVGGPRASCFAASVRVNGNPRIIHWP